MKLMTLTLSFLVSFHLFAKPAPAGMKEFNKKCPTPKMCTDLNEDMEACKKKSACAQFVVHYKAVLPEYDCQRSFDSTPKQEYVIPAIYLCENNEELLGFLAKLKTKEARILFGSQELRDTLDGSVAEEYMAKSIAVEKSLKTHKSAH